MKRVKNNIWIFELSDMKPLCDKCHSAYYGDFIASDCDYCILIDLLKNQDELAEKLAKRI